MGSAAFHRPRQIGFRPYRYRSLGIALGVVSLLSPTWIMFKMGAELHRLPPDYSGNRFLEKAIPSPALYCLSYPSLHFSFSTMFISDFNLPHRRTYSLPSTVSIT